MDKLQVDDREQERKLYICWINMKQRCYNNNHPEYFRYGYKGIVIEDSWLEFENFFNDMGYPEEGMSLDRIDGNKNYTKDNCRWTTKGMQSFNRGNVSTNNSGIKGVYKEKQTNKWKSFIGYKNKQISLGRFSSIEEAIDARRQAEMLYYGSSQL